MAANATNKTQATPLNANTMTSAAVGGAGGAMPVVSNASVNGIDASNACSFLESGGNSTTSGVHYSAYITWATNGNGYDVSSDNQAFIVHLAQQNLQFETYVKNSDSIYLILFSDGGTTNYARWHVDPTNIIDGPWYKLTMTGTPDATGGTWDNTDVTGFGFAIETNTTGSNFGIAILVDQLIYINGEVAYGDTGGAATVDWEDYYDLLYKKSGTTYHSDLNLEVKPVWAFGHPVLVEADDFSSSNSTVAFLPNDTLGFEFSTTGYYSLTFRPDLATATQSCTDEVFAYDSGSYDLTIDGTNLTTGSITFTRCSFLNTQDVSVDGEDVTLTSCTISNPTTVALEDATITGLTVDGCGGPVTIGAVLATGSSLTVTNPDADALQFDFNGVDDSGVTYTVPGGETINYNPGNTNTYTHTGIVRSGAGNITFDNLSVHDFTINVTADVLSNSATASTGGGTITLAGPVDTLTVNSSEASSDIRIFTTSTQTELASATSNTLDYDHSTNTVDITVQKAGFLPRRRTGVSLSGDQAIEFTLIADPVYDAAHGLTYTTDASWASNQLTVPTFGPSVRNVHSLLIDSFISESALRNTAYNIAMNGPNAMFLLEDAEGATDASIENMTAGGVRYVDTSDTTTAEWAGIESIGTATGFTGRYQQVDGSGTTSARATGSFDEIIKVYGDVTHGNFDYRGHLVLKYQVNGYRESRVDILDTYGVSTLEPTHYIVAMEPVAISASTGDPAITITITDHGATPVSWNGKNFGLTVTDSAGGNTAETILRELNYNFAQAPTYQGKTPFNWPEMVKELGTGYDTLRGYTEGAQSSTFKGVRVVQNDGTTAHAGFTRFQSDDGTYFTPETVAQVSAPNLTAGTIQICNSTGRAASAWVLSTAYSEGDYVLRTTGAGTELGDGVFFVCTTAGTSGGTEPTWDVTLDGNTTNDNTVVWTVRPIEFDNTTTTTGYTNSWTDGEHFASGDTIRLRWVDEDDLEIAANGVATAAGTTTFLDAPEDDTVYDAYGIDGSTVTEYAADFPNVEVDVADPDNIFYLDRFYAWWKYNLTTADGIRNFFGGVTATNASNLIINDSVVDILFDNTKAVSARQGDNIVVQRDDGTYPQVTTTSGGGGLGFYYTGIGYTTSSGSGLSATQNTWLSNVNTKTNVQYIRLDLDETKPNTYADDNSSITNDDFTLTKSDNGDGTFDIVKT